MELFHSSIFQVPILRLMSIRKKKKNAVPKKTMQKDIELVDLATIDPKPPACSTPVSSIPGLNLLNLCDISDISLPCEDIYRRISLENTKSFDDIPVSKDASKLRLERVAALVREMKLEHLYADKEDWFKDIDLDSLDYSSNDLSHHPYF